MTITVRAEEAALEALIHYVNAKPDHANGLCSWLSYIVTDPRNMSLLKHFGLPYFNGYTMMKTVRKHPDCPPFQAGGYVSRQNGPTPCRVALAEFIIDILEKGELVGVAYVSEDFGDCVHFDLAFDWNLNLQGRTPT